MLQYNYRRFLGPSITVERLEKADHIVCVHTVFADRSKDEKKQISDYWPILSVIPVQRRVRLYFLYTAKDN